MAPMLLTVDHELPFELAFAPHMLKVDAKPRQMTQSNQKPRSRYRSSARSALTIASTRRLQSQNSAATWQHIASADVVTQYVTACRTACSFLTPCGHDRTYTHLPDTLNAINHHLSKYTKATELLLDSKKSVLSLLRGETRRFYDREISAKDWIIFLEGAFGRSPKKQAPFFEHELVGILDEERRATLLLAYHAKYKAVVTRCCRRRTCFNCKREMRYHTNGVCDEDPIVADCIVECRSCHVTMVKVEGCSAVTCWCGFDMDWEEELEIRGRNKRRLIPVDVHDITTYEAWAAWHENYLNLLTSQLLPKRHALRLGFIDQQLSHTQGLRTTLQRLLQGPYIWRRHFRRALPKMEQDLMQARMRMLATRLRKSAAFVLAMGRAKWGAHWTQVVYGIHARQFWIDHKRENHAESHVLESDELTLRLPSLLS